MKPPGAKVCMLQMPGSVSTHAISKFRTSKTLLKPPAEQPARVWISRHAAHQPHQQPHGCVLPRTRVQNIHPKPLTLRGVHAKPQTLVKVTATEQQRPKHAYAHASRALDLHKPLSNAATSCYLLCLRGKPFKRRM